MVARSLVLVAVFLGGVRAEAMASCAPPPTTTGQPRPQLVAAIRDAAAEFDASLDAAGQSRLIEGMSFAKWYPLIPRSSSLLARLRSFAAAERLGREPEPGAYAAAEAVANAGRTGITWDGIVQTAVDLRRVELWEAVGAHDWLRAPTAARLLVRWAGASGSPWNPGIAFFDSWAIDGLRNALERARAEGIGPEEYAALRDAILEELDERDPWGTIAQLAEGLDAERAELLDLAGRWLETETLEHFDESVKRLATLDERKAAVEADIEGTLKRLGTALEQARQPSAREKALADITALAAEPHGFSEVRRAVTTVAERVKASHAATAWRASIAAWQPSEPVPPAAEGLVATLRWVRWSERLRDTPLDEPLAARRDREPMLGLCAALDATPRWQAYSFGFRGKLALERVDRWEPLLWHAVQWKRFAELLVATTSEATAKVDAERVERIADALLGEGERGRIGSDLASLGVLEAAMAEPTIRAAADPSQFGATIARLERRVGGWPEAMIEVLVGFLSSVEQRASSEAGAPMSSASVSKRSEVIRGEVQTWSIEERLVAWIVVAARGNRAVGIDPANGSLESDSPYRSALDPGLFHPLLPCNRWDAVLGEADATSVAEAVVAFEAELDRAIGGLVPWGEASEGRPAAMVLDRWPRPAAGGFSLGGVGGRLRGLRERLSDHPTPRE